MQLWKDDLRFFGGRSTQELAFFTAHGHWPEEACNEGECSKARFDEIVNRHNELANASRSVSESEQPFFSGRV